MLVPKSVRNAIGKKYRLLKPALGERARRLWAGTEAAALGYGGIAAVAKAIGMAPSTIGKGRDEVRASAKPKRLVRERRSGGGRVPLEVKQPSLIEALKRLVEPTTRGDPESPLRWTCKSTRVLAAELTGMGYRVSASKVGQLLRAQGYSLQGNSRVKEGKQHPSRDMQFKFINARSKAFLAHGLPVVSVDSKKKEQVGEYANGGREWQPKGRAVEVLTYDFPEPNQQKAIPYGVFDVARNEGFVNVGIDHDTPHFAVRSIQRWWELMGRQRYPNSKELFITADCGGSNASRCRAWKIELQGFSDRFGLTVHVSHFPPGTSKWNKIEHRLFSFITLNWRGRPLTTYENIVALIGSTKTAKGLRVTAELDTQKYPLGAHIEAGAMEELALFGDAFQPEWNYCLRPRTTEFIEEARQQAAGRRKPPAQPRRHHWESLMAEYRASGLRPKEFCRRRAINYSTFIMWRIRFDGVLQKQHKKSFWEKHLRQQEDRSIPSPDYCRAHGLKEETLEYWRKYFARPT